MRLMRKDIGLALATARDEGVALPSAAVADDVLRRADDLGYGDRDIAVLGEALAGGSPPGRLSRGPRPASAAGRGRRPQVPCVEARMIARS